ncbi:MAG: hypothetical protein ACXW2I_16070 [Burkholderiales bacterium]
MADNQKNVRSEVRFVDMSARQKLHFLGKALVFFISGGFVFPTMWID